MSTKSNSARRVSGLAALLSLGLALGACSATVPPPEGSGDEARCEALAAEVSVGAIVSPQPDGSVAVGTATIPASQSTRIYETGSAVTQDYRADRLNLETDTNDALVRASCG
ncbi:I78 family peptidase inhibitor [Pelagibacterium montanilacus]|uniref:I78 family peptidase inhibitor n=1 Tax=Pelagibacterium montanilacus TaxID=2185280 RepID=UPI000F8F25AE|nr:I78 family peptidase inhibitor [Pelagibacterium montanilacus]